MTTLAPRSHILGCVFDRLNMEQTVARVEEIIASRTPSQHLAVSATNVVALHDDPRLREIMHECEIVGADGQGIVWASRLLGDPLPERVSAADLMERASEEIRATRPGILSAAMSSPKKEYWLSEHKAELGPRGR
jgi:UDP-N-acetyl-D-mannosaminuronic acid transferase (WecB/TagA/CpsF family)